LEQVLWGLKPKHIEVRGSRHGLIIVEEISAVNGFVIDEVIIEQNEEFVFVEVGRLV